MLEISDVVLLITDVRHPTLHFSPALYSYVVDELGKKIVLVLNKVSNTLVVGSDIHYSNIPSRYRTCII